MKINECGTFGSVVYQILLHRCSVDDVECYDLPALTWGQSIGELVIHVTILLFVWFAGRLTANDIAAFARDSSQTPVIVLGPEDFPDRVVHSQQPWFVDFYAPVSYSRILLFFVSMGTVCRCLFPWERNVTCLVSFIHMKTVQVFYLHENGEAVLFPWEEHVNVLFPWKQCICLVSFDCIRTM